MSSVRPTPTDHAMRSLTLSRELYEHAVVQASSRYGAFGRTLAVIGFDLAVETALRTAIGALDKGFKVDKKPSFYDILAAAKEGLNSHGLGDLPNEAAIIYAHKVRNDAQHNGRFPSAEETWTCRSYAHGFLVPFLEQVWGLNFSQTTTVELVQDTVAKEWLLAAVEFARQENYTECVRYANAAVSYMFQKAFRAAFGQRFSWGRVRGVVVSDALPTPMPTGRDTMRLITEGKIWVDDRINRQIEELQQLVVASLFDVDFASRARLNRFSGEVSFRQEDGKLKFYTSMSGVTPTKDDGDFAVMFATDVVLTIENRIGQFVPQEHG